MGPREKLHAALTFEQAFEMWIERRVMRHATLVSNARIISERTEWDYRQYARALAKFFLGMKLGEVHTGHVESYQRDRAFNVEQRWDQQAGANRIKKEVGMFLRMLREAGVWMEAQDEIFEPLQQVESDIPRALSQEQQDCFLRAAGSSDRYALIYAYSILAFQTTASTNELRSLRVADVSLSQRVIQIRRIGAKNRYRIRTIPIETQELNWACETLIWRARSLGGGAPHHFLFPFGLHGGRDHLHDKPMSESGLKMLWDEVRLLAGLAWFRPYDTRHTAITRLAENGTAIPVIMDMAGHISKRMLQHYTTISMMAKRKAAASTWTVGVPQPNFGITTPHAWKRSA